jgi:hypothetical protein
MQLGKSLGIPHAASWRSGVRQRWPAHHGPWRWRAGRAWQSVGSVRPSVRVLASIGSVRAEGVGQEPGERHEVRNDEKRVEHRPAASPPYLNHQRARDLRAWRVRGVCTAPAKTTATTTVPSPPPEHSRRTTSRLRRTISSANPDVPAHGCGVAGNRERLRASLSQLFSAVHGIDASGCGPAAACRRRRRRRLRWVLLSKSTHDLGCRADTGRRLFATNPTARCVCRMLLLRRRKPTVWTSALARDEQRVPRRDQRQRSRNVTNEQ